MGDNPATSFAKNLNAVMQSRGISQGLVADRASLDQSHISMIINGKRVPGLEAAVKIAQALDTSLDWLVGLPKRDPGELDPYEQEILHIYRTLSPEAQQALFGSVHGYGEAMGVTEGSTSETES